MLQRRQAWAQAAVAEAARREAGCPNGGLIGAAIRLNAVTMNICLFAFAHLLFFSFGSPCPPPMSRIIIHMLYRASPPLSLSPLPLSLSLLFLLSFFSLPLLFLLSCQIISFLPSFLLFTKSIEKGCECMHMLLDDDV